MPQNKALYLDAKFGKFVLGYNETRRPDKGELLVRVEAVGLNPVDWSIQKWGLFVETFPAILGTDTGGVVVEVGPGVTNFAVGDRVLYQGSWANDRASYQQFNIATAATTAKIPNFLSFEAAATIPVCLTAAFLGLYNSSPHGAGYTPPFKSSSVGKYAGKPLLVLGGAGSVGQFAIQLGKLSGFSPIITTASLNHTSYLKSLGTTHVIDQHLPLSTLGATVKGITKSPIEIVYDAVSTTDTQKAGYEILASNGSMVVVLNPEVTAVDGKLIHHVFAMPNLPHTSEISANMYSKLTEWLEEGVIRPNRVEILPAGLEGVTDGLAKLEKGLVSGKKLVARPQFTGSVREQSTVSAETEEVKENGPVQNEKKVAKRRSLFRRIIS